MAADMDSRLIVTLIAADLLKDVNYLSFTAFAFIEKHVVSQSHYCQASGFFQQYLVEVTGKIGRCGKTRSY